MLNPTLKVISVASLMSLITPAFAGPGLYGGMSMSRAPTAAPSMNTQPTYGGMPGASMGRGTPSRSINATTNAAPSSATQYNSSGYASSRGSYGTESAFPSYSCSPTMPGCRY